MAGESAPLQLFGDFGFVGGEDTAPNPLQNNQTCINWYVEVDKQNAKEVVGLLGCPGLFQLAAAPGGGSPGGTVSGGTGGGGSGGGGGGGSAGVLALLHLDGPNGSNVFTYLGGSTWSPVNSATLTTSHFKFGNASLDTQLTHYITTPFATQWAFTGDFTVELFAYWNNLSTSFGDSAFVGSGAVAPKWVLFQLDASGHLDFYASVVAGTYGFHVTSSSVVSTGIWHHLAMVRSGSTITCYYDGVSFGSGTLSGTLDNSQGLAIGAIGQAFGQQFDGYIDEIRISNVAQYTSNFTPPTQPFSSPVATTWPLPSSVLNLPVRGLWELPNDQTALAVIGNTCYLVTVATPATATSFPTLALTSVGTLLTNLGPVHIRDNNIGGYAVIVDGPYGYLYNISTQAFSQITDPAFLGADTVAFIDGWWIFNQPGTQTFYTNGVQYGITFNATNFALKDSSADNLVAVMENKEQLWLIGDKTTEIWYDAGGQYFAFQRLVGTPIQAGCKAKHSVARFGTEGLIWFGRSERGENVILLSSGFSVNVVSTPAFSTELAQYPITSDAIGYTYQEDTHEFYVLTFPTADVTWCYDSQSQLLHKRLSYDPYLAKFHRHRSNCFMNFQGMRIVGDYQCGSIYQLTRNAFTDSGWPILAKRRSPHIWDKGQRGRVFMANLQLDFVPGVGNASGLGSNPQASIAISRDGGKTFGQRWSAPIGQIGQYKTRTMWRKLAFGRDNVVDLEVIDPVKRDLIGVTLRAFSA
jgi:hypothetical protein